MWKTIAGVLPAILATWSGHGAAHAATIYIWNNTTGNWTQPGKWGGSAPGGANNTDILSFGGSGASAYTSTNNLAANPAIVNQLLLSSTATVSENIAGTAISLAGASPLISQNGSGAFVISNPVTLGTGAVIGGDGAGTLSLTGPITTTTGLTKSGNSTLILTNANTYTGGTTISGGTLVAAYSDPSASETGTFAGGSSVNINSGGTLQLNGLDALGYFTGNPLLNIDGGTVTTDGTVNHHTLGTINFGVSGGVLTAVGPGGPFSIGGGLAGDYLCDRQISTALGSTATSQIIAQAVTLRGKTDSAGQPAPVTFDVLRGTAPTDLSISSVLSFQINSGLVKTGGGILTITSGLALPPTTSAAFAGGQTNISGGPVSVGSNATLSVTTGATLNVNDDMSLNGQMTRDATGVFTLAAGKTLTIQNGGDFIVTGGFSNPNSATISVTGAGSTLSTTTSLMINNGMSLNVSAGGTITPGTNNPGSSSLYVSGLGAGTVVVDGVGSSIMTPAGAVVVGRNSSAGTATFSNGSSAEFGALIVGNTAAANTTGTFRIQSGADVNVASLNGDALVIASSSIASNGTVTVDGTGSALNLTGSGNTTIGALTSSTGTLNVQNSGVYNGNTGSLTVNATGKVAIAGGTFNVNGDMVLNGQMTRDAAGAFKLAAGKTLTIQNGGSASFTGGFSNSNAAIINVNGVGSTLSTDSLVSVDHGMTLNANTGGAISSGAGFDIAVGNQSFGALNVNGGTATSGHYVFIGYLANGIANVTAGGTFTAASDIAIGTGGPGAMTVDGSGSSLSGAVLNLGVDTGNGNLTFSNGSTGTFAGITVAGDPLTGGNTGTLQIQSGASVSSTGALDIASSAVPSGGTVIINGTGSSLTFTGNTASTIGATSLSTGTLAMQAGAVFNSNTGRLTVNTTGTVAIADGTFNAKGSIFLNGLMTRGASGTFNLTAGKTLTVQNGGDFVVTGDFSNPSPSTINVTGSGSTFSTSGILSLDHSMVVSADAGGTISASAIAIPNGTVQIDGAGSALNLAGSGASTLASGSFFLSNGGVFNGNTGTFTLLPGAYMSITTGGIATFAGPLVNNSVGPALFFSTGALTIIDDFVVGPGGLLGSDVGISAKMQFTTSGTTTITPGHTLSIADGLFSTGSLVNNGTIAYSSGTLRLTASNLTIGAGGILGSNPTIATGQTVQVAGNNIVAVQPSSLLYLSGGTLSSAGGITNGGTIQLASPVASLSGGALSNAGVLRGIGTVNNPLNNSGGGAVLAMPGETLAFNGPANTNAGAISAEGGLITFSGTLNNTGQVNLSSGAITLKGALTNGGQVNLTGGVLTLDAPATNSPAGVITGRGQIRAGAGLTNSGRMNFSGGFMDIYGGYTDTLGATTIISGNSTTTFYNDVNHGDGADIRVSAGSTAVFFGAVTGTGTFSGSGAKFFEAGFSSLGAISTPGSTIVDPGASLSATQIRESALTVNGQAAILPGGGPNGTSILGALSIDPAGQFDLKNNDLVLLSSSGLTYNAVGQWIKSGLLMTSAVSPAPGHPVTLAPVGNSEIHQTTWHGLTISDGTDFNQIMVAYTYAGDVNLDGQVSQADQLNILANMSRTSATWLDGDLNGDGVVSPADLLIVTANLGAGSGGSSGPPLAAVFGPDSTASVPEPACMGLALGAGLVLLRRRRGATT